MYVRTKTSKLSQYKAVQIVEAYVAPGGKRRQRIVQHLGVARDDQQIEELVALGKRLIPELEARAREEKALREGQGLLFEIVPEDFERPVTDETQVKVKNLRNMEHVTEGPFEVWGEVFSRLGLEGIFGTGVHDIGSTNLLKLCLTAKLCDGGSKLRATEWINEALGLKLGKDRIYRMMDRLAPRIDRVKERGFLCGRHLVQGDVSLLLFDVTTLYFESFEEDEDIPLPDSYEEPPHDQETSEGGEGREYGEGRESVEGRESGEGGEEARGASVLLLEEGGKGEERAESFPRDLSLSYRGLRKKGYSKDNKVNETQVVLALATSAEGIPLWYDLFPGNMSEGKTLLESMAGVGKKLHPQETWLVADNAMLNTANRTALERCGYAYVLGASLRKLSASEKKQALDRERYAPFKAPLRDLRFGKEPLEVPMETEAESQGVTAPSEDRTWRIIRRPNGNTLVITWSAAKARRDAHKREHLLARLEKRFNPRGEIRGKDLIANRGTAKYVTPVGEEGRYRLRREALEEEAHYDGLHAVETNVPVATEEDALRVLSAYGQLWHIEDCFRVAKSELKIRPVFHWTKPRIEAHVALCFLALLMERALEKLIRTKRHISPSPKEIREALKGVQSSLVRDTESGALYRMPLALTGLGREIYRALGLRRRVETTEITSLAKYRHRVPRCAMEVGTSRSIPHGQNLPPEDDWSN